MWIARIGRWQWVVVGFLVGVALTALQLALPIGDGVEVRTRAMSASRLISSVLESQRAGRPTVRDLVVYPVRQTTRGAYQLVTGDAQSSARGEEAVYRSFGVYAAVPFLAGMGGSPLPKADAQAGTVGDFLKSVGFPYRFAWWATPPAIVALWGGGAVVLIGGVWPVLLRKLVGAGWGGAILDDPEYDLDRFGKDRATLAVAAGPPHEILPQDDADQHRLHQYEAELEAAAEGPVQETPPRLEGAEEPEAATVQERPHHYRGQYYPVDLPEPPAEDQRPKRQ